MRGWGGLKKEGLDVHRRLIDFTVQQELTQHCKVIILQFKKRILYHLHKWRTSIICHKQKRMVKFNKYIDKYKGNSTKLSDSSCLSSLSRLKKKKREEGERNIGKRNVKDELASNRVFLGFPGGSDSEESTCNERDLGLVPGLGRSPL